ncbi:hypothetical protein P4N68_02910 [Corynebacterium felinum]|uniref:Uncharacterized protein n=1 Tax=Corynebacterium felinum TaxID=131318 RepID=A0ABU2BCJ0_9CORY|nr:hypothetical protein [Corynebacterium felinum]MDF5820034.1 hypothetical protein [Corynebacterium felinum]MDR7355694.1 hypothetical protein [Corynebacterium felinum]WJY95044.1 hypothetical protein CFELI_07145 [Corynebacterium felinum]
MKHFYSPCQNIALWWAAWLYGYESFEELNNALGELHGPHRRAGEEFNFLILAKTIRDQASHMPHVPRVGLWLGGPGDPVIASSQLVAHNDSDVDTHVPAAGDNSTVDDSIFEAIVLNDETVCIPHHDRSGTGWSLLTSTRPPRAYLSPGEADIALSNATRMAARFIENSNYNIRDLVAPRLSVGRLTDFYESPGLPSAVPPRCAKLIARADQVSAIVSTVTETLGDHYFDPQLLSLAQHIRAARMAAVNYAVMEWGRLAG